MFRPKNSADLDSTRRELSFKPSLVSELSKNILAKVRASWENSGNFAYFGRMGKVVDLPSELRKMESETRVRVAIVEIDGKNVDIPRANLEMVETD